MNDDTKKEKDEYVMALAESASKHLLAISACGRRRQYDYLKPAEETYVLDRYHAEKLTELINWMHEEKAKRRTEKDWRSMP